MEVESSDIGAAAEGLRERKKRRTRRAISDTATRLFAARGFEQVTLAEIGEAAEVSVKTILNYFGTKEDLYFDRAEELHAALMAVITERPADVDLLDALRNLLYENFVPFPDHPWSVLDDPEGYSAFRGFLAVQERSPALRAHRLVLEEQLRRQLGVMLASELAREPDDPALCTLAAMLAAALQLRERALRQGILADVTPREVRRRVTAIVTECFDRLSGAFADLDPRPAPRSPNR